MNIITYSIKYYTYILILIILTISCGCSNTQSPVAQKGVIDLRNWNFRTSGPVRLSGEWEFYWNVFLSGDFSKIKYKPAMKDYIKVPAPWSKALAGKKEIPSTGYGTYRLRILLDENHEKLAIRMTTASSAYNVLINGEKVTSSGIPGTSPELSVPAYNPEVFFAGNTGPEMEILIHVSNFHYREGGLWRSVQIGLPYNLQRIKERNDYLALIISGAMLIMSFYHFGLYSLRKRDIYFLYFSILCLLIGLRTISTGEYIIVNIFHSINFKTLIGCEYLSLYLGSAVFALYMRSLYPDEFRKYVISITLFICGLYSLSVILLPTLYFTKLIISFEAVLSVFYIYTIFVIIKAIKNKRKGAVLFFAGMIIVMATLINDILHNNFIIQTGNMTGAGVFIFICIHSFILSMLFANSFNMVEKLSLDLQHLNNSLENKVMQRTEELQSAYDNIRELTKIDPLTKCFNKSYLNENLPKEIERAKRYNSSMSLIICDIDHFKKVNDTYGHLSGDHVLQIFPERIKQLIRSNIDWVVRFGGEEFIIILPETPFEKTMMIAERMRASIESFKVIFNSTTISISASFGVTGINTPDYSSADELINFADSKLYEAKKSGRNRVIGGMLKQGPDKR